MRAPAFPRAFVPATLTVILLVVGAFAGCLSAEEDQKATEPEVSIARIITIALDESHMMADDVPAFKDVVRTRYEIRVRDASYDTSLLTFSYTNAGGDEVSGSLLALTGRSLLAPGEPILVDDVDFASPASLTLAGKVLASRDVAAVEGWRLNGESLGAGMAPGSLLKYALESRILGEFTVDNYDAELEDGSHLHLSRAGERLEIREDGFLEARVAAAPENREERSAYPVDLKVGSKVSLAEFVIEAMGSLDDEAFDTGLTIRDLTFEGNAHGRLWFSELRELFAFDVLGGLAKADAKFFAWATGLPEEFTEALPCERATRANPCDLEEIRREMGLPMEESLDPSEETFEKDGADGSMDDGLERLLTADMRRGDAFRFRVSFDFVKAFDLAGRENLPDVARLEMRLDVDVGDLVRVDTVNAGSMRAHAITETVRFRVEISPFEDGDFRFEGLHLEEEPVRTTIHLAETTFVPVKVTSTAPTTMDSILDRVLESVGDSAWEGIPGEFKRPDDYRIRTEGGGTLLLDSLEGDVRFAPWPGLVYAHFLSRATVFGLAPFAMVGGFGGPGYAPVHEDWEWDEEPVPRSRSPLAQVDILGGLPGQWDSPRPPEDAAVSELRCPAGCPDGYTVWLRILDASGHPIPYAYINLDAENGYGYGMTDDEGIAAVQAFAWIDPGAQSSAVVYTVETRGGSLRDVFRLVVEA